MTRASTIDFGRRKQGELLGSGPLRPANIIRNKFPTFKNGSNGIIIKLADGPDMPSLKEAVAKDTTDPLDKHQRLSVRELTMKFEKGFNTATLLSNEVKWRHAALLERDTLLKNLKSVLESLRSRVGGKNRDEIEESLSMVDILAVQLSQREDELLQQKAEVTKIAASLKLASEDAKRIVDEERANARLEIESAKGASQRVQLALKEQENVSQRTGQQDVDELKEEVQEARRVKMLHCPSMAMDIESEIQVLRNQLAEKSSDSVHLLKEGLETLGSMLHIVVRGNASVDFSNGSIQWFHIHPEGSKKEIISGATKPVYAPEPHDVGRYIQAEITFGGQISIAKTAGPVDPAAGLADYVETLMRNPEMEYNVVILQVNGVAQPADSLHVFCIGRLRMRLARGTSVVAKEFYSSSMQLCGVRGGGDAAPQAIFWQPRKELSFVLGFETTRERNSALMLARRFAMDCNIILAGPGDKTPC
ncbi:unnamed protein product [Urochloa decumbens]|uniref:Stomatal closure-related actin-binding protein 1 n=1 Tax=Urochloa decumbens TaxID=240449 RepID=A0ABC9G2K8_9POAL